MKRCFRISAAVCSLAAALFATPCHAQAVIDRAFTGFWLGLSAAEELSINIRANGSVNGSVRLSLISCTYKGAIHPVDGDATRLDGLVIIDLDCANRAHDRREIGAIRGTPSGLQITLLGHTLELQRLGASLGAVGAGPAAQIRDPLIAGQWRGSASGVSAMLALARSGQISGSVTGTAGANVFDGCRFTGTVPPRGAFENADNSFAAVGQATMTGCTDTSLDTRYGVVIAADRESLGIQLIDVAGLHVLFEMEGMTRTGPLLGSAIDPAIAGNFSGEVHAIATGGTGPSRRTMAIAIEADGTVSGTFPGTSCVVNGALTSSREDAPFGTTVWQGAATISGCRLPGLALFNKAYAIFIEAREPFDSTSVEMVSMFRGMPDAMVFGGLARQ